LIAAENASPTTSPPQAFDRAMKSITKSILHHMGLLKFARKFRRNLFPTDSEKKYRKIHRYRLSLRGVTLVLSTEDEHSRNWIYPRYDHGKYHEPAITNLFIDKVKSDFCVIDVGVNIGWFTCLAALLAKDGHVHAFEVDDNCLPLIKKNLQLNQLDNVTINVCAASDHVGDESIPVSSRPDAELKLLTDSDSSGKKTRTVEAVTIDEYLKNRALTPDFIKIDVEGAELKVLHGMTETLKLSKLILLVEIHVENLKDHFETDYRDVIRILADNGFSLREITSHRLDEKCTLRRIDPSSRLKSNPMILCQKGQ